MAYGCLLFFVYMISCNSSSNSAFHNFCSKKLWHMHVWTLEFSISYLGKYICPRECWFEVESDMLKLHGRLILSFFFPSTSLILLSGWWMLWDVIIILPFPIFIQLSYMCVCSWWFKLVRMTCLCTRWLVQSKLLASLLEGKLQGSSLPLRFS